MSNYKALIEQAEALMRQADAAREAERPAALETCKQLIADYDLSAFELGFVKVQELKAPPVKTAEKTFGPAKPKVIYPPKYVDPASGRTWSGRGHQPGWITGNRDDYLIKTDPPKRITQNNKGQ
jgi:DNA-binding protein H-NS